MDNILDKGLGQHVTHGGGDNILDKGLGQQIRQWGGDNILEYIVILHYCTITDTR